MVSPRGVLTIIALALSAACRADTATQEPEKSQPVTAETKRGSAVERPARALVPQNPLDRTIRRELSLAIQQDPELRSRDISFIVSNGDVSVSGVVGSEPERQRINELALAIGGVKSVANAVRISP